MNTKLPSGDITKYWRQNGLLLTREIVPETLLISHAV